MTDLSDTQRRFPDAKRDIETWESVPDTPQTRSPTYRLAFDDPDFLTRKELRPVRLQLELLKCEMALSEAGIISTIVMFGGARIPPPEQANSARTPELARLSRYYTEARNFARLATLAAVASGNRENVVCTGGGPGVMEAGSRGAVDGGGVSVSLNIVLPHEQVPNLYGTPELSFNFHYFAIRKMHFLTRAKAIAVFPGGFGTLDELFEALTLVQTRRMSPLPIVLFGQEFWDTIVNWQSLADAGTISPEDLGLFHYVETGEEAWAYIEDWYARTA